MHHYFQLKGIFIIFISNNFIQACATEGFSPNVKKDRKKFGLRKKKSGKGSSVDLNTGFSPNKAVDNESSSPLSVSFLHSCYTTGIHNMILTIIFYSVQMYYKCIIYFTIFFKWAKSKYNVSVTYIVVTPYLLLYGVQQKLFKCTQSVEFYAPLFFQFLVKHHMIK